MEQEHETMPKALRSMVFRNLQDVAANCSGPVRDEGKAQLFRRILSVKEEQEHWLVTLSANGLDVDDKIALEYGLLRVREGQTASSKDVLYEFNEEKSNEFTSADLSLVPVPRDGTSFQGWSLWCATKTASHSRSSRYSGGCLRQGWRR